MQVSRDRGPRMQKQEVTLSAAGRVAAVVPSFCCCFLILEVGRMTEAQTKPESSGWGLSTIPTGVAVLRGTGNRGLSVWCWGSSSASRRLAWLRQGPAF